MLSLRQPPEQTERQQDHLQLEEVDQMAQRDQPRMRLEVDLRKMEEENHFRWERRREPVVQGRRQILAHLQTAHQRRAATWKSDTQQ